MILPVGFHLRFCLAAAFLAVVLCNAQQQPAPEISTSAAAPVFRSSTSLVQIPVVVRDSSGHAVGTLGQDDFQLFDNNKPQIISRFSVEKFDTAVSLQQASVNPGGTKSGDAATASGGPPAISTSVIPGRFVAL